MIYKVNKNKCIGCGSCTVSCPEGMELGEDGKANVLNQEKVEACGGESLCPFEAIEKTE